MTKYVAWFTLSTGGYALHRDGDHDPEVLANFIASALGEYPFFHINNGNNNPEVLNRDHVVKVVIKEDRR